MLERVFRRDLPESAKESLEQSITNSGIQCSEKKEKEAPKDFRRKKYCNNNCRLKALHERNVKKEGIGVFF